MQAARAAAVSLGNFEQETYMIFQAAFDKKLLILAGVIAAAGFFPLNSVAYAEETKMEVSDPNAMTSSLQKLVGKSVTLRLHSGEDISGIVEAVGPNALRLGQLTGKEYYSAIIKVDDVSAITYRAKS